MSVLYVRVPPKLKDSLEELAKCKGVGLAGYVRGILVNHVEMDKFVKSQQMVNPAIQTINPALMEMWQFMARPSPIKPK